MANLGWQVVVVGKEDLDKLVDQTKAQDMIMMSAGFIGKLTPLLAVGGT